MAHKALKMTVLFIHSLPTQHEAISFSILHKHTHNFRKTIP